MPEIIECEVCGAKCHGLPADAGGELILTKAGQIAPLEKAEQVLPRCLMHLPEASVDTTSPLDVSGPSVDSPEGTASGGAAKKKGKK